MRLVGVVRYENSYHNSVWSGVEVHLVLLYSGEGGQYLPKNRQCGRINSATDQRTNICFVVLKFLPRTVYLDHFMHPHMT